MREPLYASLCTRLATGTAATKLGASIDIVAPGKRACPYHFHYAQEEMFVVLEGSGTLRVAGEMLPLHLPLRHSGLHPEKKPVNRTMETLRGTCHCSAVQFEIDTDFPELTTCDCSICRRRNAVMVKVHESRFRLLRGADALRLYQFHTMTAMHYFCGVCGIYPFHRKRLAPDHYGVNVFCLEGFDATGIPVRATVGAAMD